MIFLAFGKYLGFGGCFCSFKFQWEKSLKIDFSSFYKYLGFGGCFLLIKFQLQKSLKNWFFQLLAVSWFCWLLFPITIQKKWKRVSPAFGNILVLVVAFSYWNSNLKGIEKLFFSSFWQYLGFGGCFFYLKFQLKNDLKIDFSNFWQYLGFGGCFFQKNQIPMIPVVPHKPDRFIPVVPHKPVAEVSRIGNV